MSRVQGDNDGFEVLRARFQGPGFRGLGFSSALNKFTIFFLISEAMSNSGQPPAVFFAQCCLDCRGSVRRDTSSDWVAVKELKLSYYIGGNLLFTVYTHSGNLI